MSKHPEYDVTLKEVHHTQKKDSPSGTAVTLAEGVLQHFTNKTNWVNEAAANPQQLSIISERTDPAPGTHHVLYSSAIDDIEIIHTAHNRTGFATGAVLAAEYIFNKKGFFTMNDVLGL
jgi:4-hydroxy-tetrahydrodipicolinate reductase